MKKTIVFMVLLSVSMVFVYCKKDYAPKGFKLSRALKINGSACLEFYFKENVSEETQKKVNSSFNVYLNMMNAVNVAACPRDDIIGVCRELNEAERKNSGLENTAIITYYYKGQEGIMKEQKGCEKP